MAQALTIGIPLARHRTGLAASLRAQLRNTAGATVGSLVSTGFFELGQGHYEFHYAAYPDGFEGVVEFTVAGAPTVPVASIALNNASFGVSSAANTAAIAAAVWAYATRTVTMAAAALAAAIQGSTIVLRRGDTISVSITGLGNISARTKLWFTVKESEQDTDAQSILQIIETTGLTFLNGAAAVAGQGSLTVTDATAGNVTIALAAAASEDLELASNLYYDLQMLAGSTVTTLAEGALKVIRDATRATS